MRPKLGREWPGHSLGQSCRTTRLWLAYLCLGNRRSSREFKGVPRSQGISTWRLGTGALRKSCDNGVAEVGGNLNLLVVSGRRRLLDHHECVCQVAYF